MTFTTRNPRETEAQEVARLAAAPEGSTNHDLSQLPVLNPLITTGMLIRLEDGRWDEPVVVTPMEYHHRTTPEGTTTHRHGGSWTCRVVGGSHKTYSPGCWDIDLSTAELVRSHRVII